MPTAPSPTETSPLVGRIAWARGIDLAARSGSGAGGRVMLADLGLGKLATAPPPPEKQPAQISMTTEVRLDALMTLRETLNRDLAARGVALTFTDMFIRAQALALVACDFGRTDIVVIGSGLAMPVIASADTKSLSAISREMKALTEGGSQPDADHQATASLADLSASGIRQLDAVITPPQVLALALGAAQERMIVIDGQPLVATMVTATGSFDRQTIDSTGAAAFMQAFRDVIEHPTGLLA